MTEDSDNIYRKRDDTTSFDTFVAAGLTGALALGSVPAAYVGAVGAGTAALVGHLSGRTYDAHLHDVRYKYFYEIVA